ncbi:MAG: ankyrin repeat domain-containing protein [Steroidobacteraceae bacterium]
MRFMPVAIGVLAALNMTFSGGAAFAQSVPGLSSVLVAVKAHDVAAVGALLKKGADVNAPDIDGTTPLMAAVHERDTAMIQTLIAAGAAVEATNRYGATALQTAARNGDARSADLLLKAGANPGAAMPEGETVLMAAARTGNIDLINALLAGGKGKSGDMNKADPNYKEGWKGQTALMWAAAEGHADAIAALIAGGANPNEFSAEIIVPQPNPERRSGGFVYPNIPKGRMVALHFAARNGKLEAAKALVNGKADLNLVDADGSTAVILAALNGHPDVAVALLEAGADPKVADKFGRTALFVATDMNTREAEARPAPVVTGEKTYVDVIKTALAKGADVNATLKTPLPAMMAQSGFRNGVLRAGATSFLRASMSADLEVMKILLAAGADPLKATDKDDGPAKQPFFGFNTGSTTPLMAAAGVGWRDEISRGRVPDAIEAIKLLLAKGADVNQANNAGNTPLIGAAIRGEPALVEFLLQQGANPNAKNGVGLTAMDVAMGSSDNSLLPNPLVAAVLNKHKAPAKLSAR